MHTLLPHQTVLGITDPYRNTHTNGWGLTISSVLEEPSPLPPVSLLICCSLGGYFVCLFFYTGVVISSASSGTPIAQISTIYANVLLSGY